MKIKQIRVVSLDIPLAPPKSKPTRPAANKVAARRALPINYYPEFSTEFGTMPGAGAGDVWVQVIAEDGTFGLGACSYGEPVAALIDYHYAPLLEGRPRHGVPERPHVAFGAELRGERDRYRRTVWR